ncbi:MAG: DUF29 domain-containing protein [Microcystaceae cyanobacterium]
MNSIAEIKQLYESDYLAWITVTTSQLKQKQFDQLDYENLVEELEDLGKEQRNKVDSYLRQLLIHLLLYAYWESEKNYCAKGWAAEIDNFRFELELLLKSKTLYNYFLSEINFIYAKAKKQVIKKTELPQDVFPQSCPFAVDQILNPDFFP